MYDEVKGRRHEAAGGEDLGGVSKAFGLFLDSVPHALHKALALGGGYTIGLRPHAADPILYMEASLIHEYEGKKSNCRSNGIPQTQIKRKLPDQKCSKLDLQIPPRAQSVPNMICKDNR